MEVKGIGHELPGKLLIDGQELEDSQRLPHFDRDQTVTVQLVRQKTPEPKKSSRLVEVRTLLTGELLHLATLHLGTLSELRVLLAKAGVGQIGREMQLILGVVVLKQDDLLQEHEDGSPLVVNVVWGVEKTARCTRIAVRGRLKRIV